MEMGLFNILVGVKEDGIDSDELAESTGGDRLLIGEYSIWLDRMFTSRV